MISKVFELHASEGGQQRYIKVHYFGSIIVLPVKN